MKTKKIAAIDHIFFSLLTCCYSRRHPLSWNCDHRRTAPQNIAAGRVGVAHRRVQEEIGQILQKMENGEEKRRENNRKKEKKTGK